MIAMRLVLISLIISTNALSIGTVSEQNVTKREANLADLFPDWVPFKNKHGEELGEFVQVNRKPKKRLALPVNFILRAVAEPETDDYYEKVQGESDSEDYFEKRDWSDVNRSVQESDPPKSNKHTEISDIDSVVNILTKRPTKPVVAILEKAKQNNSEKNKDEEEKKQIQVKDIVFYDSMDPSKKISRKYEDDNDYEDSTTDKHKIEPIEEEQSENEAKKEFILDSVDELKDRHAEEQVAIMEKAKEEEIYKEEREREKIQAQLSNAETDKYEDRSKVKIKKYPDYEEYEDKEVFLEEKYRVNSERTKPTTTHLPKRTYNRKEKKEKKLESGKLSVFKNPHLYIVYDDQSEDESDDETSTSNPKKLQTTNEPNNVKKYSTKYTAAPTNKNNQERISLVPEDSDGEEGEPTLFFPKRIRLSKTKNRKGKKPTNVSESMISQSTPTSPSDKKGNQDNLASGSDYVNVDTVVETGPSGSDTAPTDSETVTDAMQASSQQHKESEKKDDNYHREKGGSRQHHSEHEEEHSEEGKKAYEGVHKKTKSSKGYHDKEDHLGKYDDHGGIDQHHEEESGHYGDHHHEEHGKKHAKYEESGKHSKGHSTKGSHDIHKKEEFEKKVEFFEEEGDSGEEEKHGGFNEEHGNSKGGNFKNGNYKAAHEEHAKGDRGHFEKGGHLHVSKGRKSAYGHDGHGKNGNSQHQKESKDSGKKWIYHHGYPPKTANLVLIDRRTDQLYHGPQYYG